MLLGGVSLADGLLKGFLGAEQLLVLAGGLFALAVRHALLVDLEGAGHGVGHVALAEGGATRCGRRSAALLRLMLAAAARASLGSHPPSGTAARSRSSSTELGAWSRALWQEPPSAPRARAACKASETRPPR